MTDFSNGADGKPADQPRFLFPANDKSAAEASGSTNRGAIVAVVPICVVVITILAISTAKNTPVVPPTMEALTSTRPQPPPEPAAPPVKTISEPIVRVNITPGGVDSVQIELRGRCELISLQAPGQTSVELPAGKLTVTSTETGLKVGTLPVLAGPLEIRPAQSPIIVVDRHLYRGQVRLFRRKDGKVSVVNVLPIEEYLASVVDSEMPAKFPLAARQAQAIVARTYALYQIQQSNAKSVYDLLSSQRSQKYLGVEYPDRSGRRLAGESESSRNAVKATRGKVCLFQGEIFCTYYSAVCGGQTTNGADVFKDACGAVQSVTCEWCHESPHFRWTTEIPRADLEKSVFGSDKRSGKTVSIQSIEQQDKPGPGRIPQFVFHDESRTQSLSGIELRERLPIGKLFSPHVKIKLESDRVLFEGRGHGHGVGFCQWGSKGLAEAGRNAEEIVRYYFRGAEIGVHPY